MGVDVGDRLLARFGKRLACHVAGGVVGRMGEDEFMVLRLGITVSSCRAREDGGDHGVLFQRLESTRCSAQRLAAHKRTDLSGFMAMYEV